MEDIEEVPQALQEEGVELPIEEEKEAELPVEEEPKPKRRGRPPGSTKPKATPKKRGRPRKVEYHDIKAQPEPPELDYGRLSVALAQHLAAQKRATRDAKLDSWNGFFA